jgi:hypothetical protein
MHEKDNSYRSAFKSGMKEQVYIFCFFPVFRYELESLWCMLIAVVSVAKTTA